MKKLLKFKLIVFVIIVGIVALTACTNQSDTGNGFTLENSDIQYSLVFNEAEWVMSVSPEYPSEYYFVQLTDEQINTVFYGLNINPNQASILFRDDSSFSSITAHDASMGILIGIGYMHGSNMSADYGGTPVISDVHGIPVVAFIVNTDRERTSGAFFQASFRLEDMPYNITLWNTDVSEGKERLTEIVSILITNNLDLSAFSVSENLH